MRDWDKDSPYPYGPDINSKTTASGTPVDSTNHIDKIIGKMIGFGFLDYEPDDDVTLQTSDLRDVVELAYNKGIDGLQEAEAQARRTERCEVYNRVLNMFNSCEDGGNNYTHFYEDFVVCYQTWLIEQIEKNK